MILTFGLRVPMRSYDDWSFVAKADQVTLSDGITIPGNHFFVDFRKGTKIKEAPNQDQFLNRSAHVDIPDRTKIETLLVREGEDIIALTEDDLSEYKTVNGLS